jgi:hypothetical protein
MQAIAASTAVAARAFENDAPFAARGIDSAAEYVEDAAEKIRNGSFRDLIDNTTDFAKRQPAAFLGISVLAGLAAVRFLKASGGGASSSSRSDTNQASSSRRADAWTSSAPGSSSENFSRPQQSSSSQRGGVS